MRAFIGIPISEDLKGKILKIQEKFREFDIKFVEKGNLHFNLKFLDEIPEEKTTEIKSSLGNLSQLFETFEINIRGMGVFPNENYIRVVWIGVKKGYQQMLALAEVIENALVDLGIEREAKKFEPHLTLGRVRSARNKKELAETVERYKDLEIGTMKVDRLVLFESVLTRQGPIYKEVFSITLK
jgi:2'-5' RNA ligase